MQDEGSYRWPRLLELCSSCALSPDQGQFAVAIEHGVAVISLDDTSKPPKSLFHGGLGLARQRCLCWSPRQRHRLATSSGDSVIIWNVNTRNPTFTLSGRNGRAVTCVAFNVVGLNQVAVGYVDGAVHLYNIDGDSKLVQRINAYDGTCYAVAFKPDDSNMIASYSHGEVHLWDLRQPIKPYRTVSTGSTRVTSLVWCPYDTGKLLTVSSDGWVRVWDVSKGNVATAGSEGDEGVLGPLEEFEDRALWEMRASASIRRVIWLGSRGVLTLTDGSKSVYLYSVVATEAEQAVWEATTEVAEATDFSVQQFRESGVGVIILDGVQVLLREVPRKILESVGWQHGQLDLDRTPTEKQHQSACATMRTLPISAITRREHGTFSRTAKQLFRQRSTRATSRATLSELQAIEPSPAITATRMTDSLELPMRNDDESLMPFLSPSIPAKKPAPGNLIAMDDTIEKLSPLYASRLQPIRLPSFDTEHADSDSDEETFANSNLYGPGTLMPGGVNVPLPKACGALFAQNGKLLIFLPPKLPKAQPSPIADADELDGPPENLQLRSIPRVFATFGKISQARRRRESGSDDSDWSDSGNSSEERFTIPPPSWPASYHSKTSPTNSADPANGPRVRVTVREVDDILPSMNTLAYQYRVLLDREESSSHLCQHNAAVAESAGLDNVAGLWRLLALALEDAVPLSTMSSSAVGEDVLVIARQATSMKRSDSGIDVSLSARCRGKLSWASHPFGGAWLIDKIFVYLERQNDVQSLALMSAVLSEQTRPISRKADGIMPRKLPSYQPPYFGSEDAWKATHSKSTPIFIPPVTGGEFYESPVKLHQNSDGSSRANSQPQTPHFESGSLTPPWSIKNQVSGQASRISASGSVSGSPEHHRSSFSAAAKYYAQSITDKFASYGTSPPAKRSQELSTSVPLSSSFAKSVSFASTATNTHDSQLSRSLASYEFEGDDNTDKTTVVEQKSGFLPVASRSPQVGVTVRLMNQDCFDGDAFVPLLSGELRGKGHLWRTMYADMLRCWGLPVEAAELEKVSGIVGLTSSLSNANDAQGVMPVSERNGNIFCVICYCAVVGACQFCSSCGHTAHTGCLEELVATLDYESYVCASGCGCECDALALADLD